MAPSVPGKTLSKLGLCLLLIGNMLVWSASWNTSAFHGGQFEQLGDSSPPFLVGAGDGSSGDDACADSHTARSGIGLASSAVQGAVRAAVATRIRISRYPVLPQAPPVFT